jgi:hypothetical protein
MPDSNSLMAQHNFPAQGRQTPFYPADGADWAAEIAVATAWLAPQSPFV